MVEEDNSEESEELHSVGIKATEEIEYERECEWDH